MKGTHIISGIAIAVISIATTVTVLNAAEPASSKKFKDIEDVMKFAHKGKDSIAAHVRDGKGTDEEFETLLRCYEFLATQKPPRGDMADWKVRTTGLVEAAKALQAHKPGAVARYKKAVDCKACHDLHKPKDD